MEENRKKNGRIAQKIPLKNKEVEYELLKKYAIIYWQSCNQMRKPYLWKIQVNVVTKIERRQIETVKWPQNNIPRQNREKKLVTSSWAWTLDLKLGVYSNESYVRTNFLCVYFCAHSRTMYIVYT